MMTKKTIAVTKKVVKSPEDEVQTLPRLLPQYITSLSITLGSIAVGLSLAWTSPAGENGVSLWYPFDLSAQDFSWISSAFTIGSGLGCVPLGMLIDPVGRKRTLLYITVPFTIGWACIIWPNCVEVVIVGRFILGICSSAFFTIGPIYIAEISDSENRGRLSSYNNLFVYFGVFSCYALGLIGDMYVLSLISAAVPIIFFASFFFMPETPTYYLMKNNAEEAQRTLVWLRGKHYDVELELEEKRKGVIEAELNKVSFFVAIRSRAAIRGLVVAYGLMFFQALSGVDVLIYYMSTMYTAATGRDGTIFSIVIGGIQVAAVFMFSFLIDNWGRRALLLVSGCGMFLTNLGIGIYFYVYENHQPVDNYTWVSILCIVGFIVFYSFGYGGIPWIMLGELFSPHTKAVAANSACMIQSFMSFAVVQSFSGAQNAFDLHGLYWIYSGAVGVGTIFVYFVVPETKNKTLEQIQAELGAEVVCNAAQQCTRL